MDRINVTKTFLPPIEEYNSYVEQIWHSGQLTNQGSLVKEFEAKTEDYLHVKNLQFLSNGTIALQLALRALDITEGEVITTPFSYVATTSSILWERCVPIYVDIDPETLCIDASKIEAAITNKTKAIMSVHVFGVPCDVEKIAAIAKKHNLKVIYDGAHAFGVEYKNKSLLSYGDISTCSFHATKLFHTIEGGCAISNSDDVNAKIELMKRFGHDGDDHYMLGINAKASEFQAAMGLSNLKYIDSIIENREHITNMYNKYLSKKFTPRKFDKDIKYNYSYYPLIIENEDELERLLTELNASEIYPRRYFYPSLNTLPYLEGIQSCPISEDIANRTMCLPVYNELTDENIKSICDIILR